MPSHDHNWVARSLAEVGGSFGALERYRGCVHLGRDRIATRNHYVLTQNGQWVPAAFSWIQPGVRIHFQSLPGPAGRFAGTVATFPLILGSVWVVNLKDMEPKYSNTRNTVTAAACDCLFPAIVSRPKVDPSLKDAVITLANLLADPSERNALYEYIRVHGTYASNGSVIDNLAMQILEVAGTLLDDG
jgi:hypothetical protein